ncbi:hypothetical protein ACQ4LK_20650, partial [Bacillus pumilus]
MINEKRLLDEFLELVQIDSETKHEEKIEGLLSLKKNSEPTRPSTSSAITSEACKNAGAGG